MCGITGIITPGVEKYREEIERMVGTLRHRGPDDMGTCFFSQCALGHTRLTIIDPEKGHQPMLSQDRMLAVTFNGEIYGYQDLRRSMKEYSFQTFSDTEVLLALYAVYGEAMLSHLPGMFAFALWDERKAMLFCARDRFGEKPFYYALGQKGEFLFASELKAIIASNLVEPALSEESLVHYFRHLYVHPSRSIYENIYALPPAHSLTYKDGRIEVNRYWHLPATDETIAIPEATERFRFLFDKAVRSQLVADVDVGAFLSGGLDSSTVVAVASDHKKKLKTISFGFSEANNDLPFAREVAAQYETDHEELWDRDLNIADLLVTMSSVYDEPFADSSNIPTYLICRAARRHLKVVLTGDGGDELLAGYDFWYAPLYQMENTALGPPWKQTWVQLFSRILRRIGLSTDNRSTTKDLAWEWRRAFGTIARAHLSAHSYMRDADFARLGLGAIPEPEALPEELSLSDTLDDVLRLDLQCYLPGDILVKIDRASMANGLELRAPFLDVDFATFCISLPSRLKINAEGDKLILREAYADCWPPSLQNRGKQGFGAPVEKWLRQPSVYELKRSMLDDRQRKIFDVLSFEGTRFLVEQNNQKTWTLLMLALWMENHSFSWRTA
jgi:asparagine synthase (glutamine-hydrolysing)